MCEAPEGGGGTQVPNGYWLPNSRAANANIFYYFFIHSNIMLLVSCCGGDGDTLNKNNIYLKMNIGVVNFSEGKKGGRSTSNYEPNKGRNL